MLRTGSNTGPAKRDLNDRGDPSARRVQQCPVCMEDFGAGTARTEIRPFACLGEGHGVCTRCDAALAIRGHDECPLCRRPRRVPSAGGRERARVNAARRHATLFFAAVAPSDLREDSGIQFFIGRPQEPGAADESVSVGAALALFDNSSGEAEMSHASGTGAPTPTDVRVATHSFLSEARPMLRALVDVPSAPLAVFRQLATRPRSHAAEP